MKRTPNSTSDFMNAVYVYRQVNYDIQGSQGGKHSDGRLLGCNAIFRPDDGGSMFHQHRRVNLWLHNTGLK